MFLHITFTLWFTSLAFKQMGMMTGAITHDGVIKGNDVQRCKTCAVSLNMYATGKGFTVPFKC